MVYLPLIVAQQRFTAVMEAGAPGLIVPVHEKFQTNRLASWALNTYGQHGGMMMCAVPALNDVGGVIHMRRTADAPIIPEHHLLVSNAVEPGPEPTQIFYMILEELRRWGAYLQPDRFGLVVVHLRVPGSIHVMREAIAHFRPKLLLVIMHEQPPEDFRPELPRINVYTTPPADAATTDE